MDEQTLKKEKAIYRNAFRGFKLEFVDEDGNEVDSAYEADLKRALQDEAKIVSFLVRAIPDTEKEVIREEIEKNSLWITLQHLRYGMYIRNLLRKQGFNYDIYVMDEMWSFWLQKALQERPRD